MTKEEIHRVAEMFAKENSDLSFNLMPKTTYKKVAIFLLEYNLSFTTANLFKIANHINYFFDTKLYGYVFIKKLEREHKKDAVFCKTNPPI